jgi:hypothetical protein
MTVLFMLGRDSWAAVEAYGAGRRLMPRIELLDIPIHADNYTCTSSNRIEEALAR